MKKTVERDRDDSCYVITTYDGVHNHESPSVVYRNHSGWTSQRPGHSSNWVQIESKSECFHSTVLQVKSNLLQDRNLCNLLTSLNCFINNMNLVCYLIFSHFCIMFVVEYVRANVVLVCLMNRPDRVFRSSCSHIQLEHLNEHKLIYG